MSTKWHYFMGLAGGILFGGIFGFGLGRYERHIVHVAEAVQVAHAGEEMAKIWHARHCDKDLPK